MTGPFPIKLVALIGLLAAALPARSQPVGSATPPKPIPTPPLLTSAPSRIDYFRQLLAAPPAGRETLLAGKTPEQRQVLLSSLREYDVLPAPERELRLLALELRLHLSALIRLSPTNRAMRLAMVPETVIPLVNERLQRWDRYTPAEQTALLENEKAVREVLSLEQGRPVAEVRLTSPTPPQLIQMEKDIARWRELPLEQQRKIYGHFQTIFDLKDLKQDPACDRLNETEKAQMERTLTAFKQLSKSQRDLCIYNFNRFAEMSPTQRRQFLVNAETWAQLKPEDRQLWRDLVKKVPPMPPSPPGLGGPPQPPMPRPPVKTSVVATNP